MDQIPEDLTIRVLRWTTTVPKMRKAIRLLAVSPWLTDRPFVEACIVDIDDCELPTALVDWAAVADFLARGPVGENEDIEALRMALGFARSSYK